MNVSTDKAYSSTNLCSQYCTLRKWICMYVYIHLCVYTYVQSGYACMFIYIRACVYIYTYIEVYIYTHTHTHIQCHCMELFTLWYTVVQTSHILFSHSCNETMYTKHAHILVQMIILMQMVTTKDPYLCVCVCVCVLYCTDLPQPVLVRLWARLLWALLEGISHQEGRQGCVLLGWQKTTTCSESKSPFLGCFFAFCTCVNSRKWHGMTRDSSCAMHLPCVCVWVSEFAENGSNMVTQSPCCCLPFNAVIICCFDTLFWCQKKQTFSAQ